MEWAAFPRNRALNATGVLVIAVIFDILTPIEAPANNANNAVMKIWEMSKNIRAAIVQARPSNYEDSPNPHYAGFIVTFLRWVMFGMTSVTNAEIFAHLRAAYSELDQNDYSILYSRLQSAKLPTEDFKTPQRLIVIFMLSWLSSTELAKSNYFMEALQSDYAGHEACREFVRAHPQVATTRTFANLVATVLLHAPTSIPTTSAFEYTNAQTTLSVASAAPLAPTTEEAALVAHIAESQRKLLAIRRTNGSAPAAAPKAATPAPGGGPLKAWLPV